MTYVDPTLEEINEQMRKRDEIVIDGSIWNSAKGDSDVENVIEERNYLLAGCSKKKKRSSLLRGLFDLLK